MKGSLQRLETKPFPLEREWTVEGVPVLRLTGTLPQPVGKPSRLTRRIQRFYQHQARCYLRYCQRFLLPLAEEAHRAALAASTPLPLCTAQLRYEVTCNQGGVWSLYTESREVCGRDGHGPPPGGYLGPAHRLPPAPLRLLPPALAGAQDPSCPGGGGHPRPGWPLAGGLAALPPPELQPGELLPLPGGAALLLADVRPGRGGAGGSQLPPALWGGRLPLPGGGGIKERRVPDGTRRCLLSVVLGVAGVEFHGVAVVRPLSLRQGADDLGGAPQNQGAIRGVHLAGDEGSRPHQAVVPDLRPVEDDGPHADEGIIPHGAAVDDGPMADGAVLPHGGVGVQDGGILDVGVLPHVDGALIAPDHRLEPDADALFQRHVAHHHGGVGDEDILVALSALIIHCCSRPFSLTGQSCRRGKWGPLSHRESCR